MQFSQSRLGYMVNWGTGSTQIPLQGLTELFMKNQLFVNSGQLQWSVSVRRMKEKWNFAEAKAEKHFLKEQLWLLISQLTWISFQDQNFVCIKLLNKSIYHTQIFIYDCCSSLPLNKATVQGSEETWTKYFVVHLSLACKRPAVDSKLEQSQRSDLLEFGKSQSSIILTPLWRAAQILSLRACSEKPMGLY